MLHPEPMMLSSGQVLGRYRILEALGAGGMGEVYRARDEILARDVALKLLSRDLVRDPERVRRFVLEARAASSLNHPHIVTIYDVGTDEPSGIHFIAMELVDGKTLRQILRDPKVELKSCLRFLAQAAEGLARAHAEGVIHRDLKPENVMVTHDGYAKVLDFGLAKLTEKRDTTSDPGNTLTITNMTSPGSVLGTVGYMSPEQVQGRPTDQRTDIFSFGCLLFEAAAGQRAFAADSDVETMHRILKDEPSLESLDPRAPADLERLIRRCLAKDPDQRLQSMRDVAIELFDVVRDYDTLPSISGARRDGSAVKVASAPGWKALTAVGVAVLLVGVAAIAIERRVWTRGEPDPSTTAFDGMKMTPLLERNNLGNAALSPDGKYLAISSEDKDGWRLWVRQVATGSDVRVLGPQQPRIGSLRFAPDSDYLYYCTFSDDPTKRGYASLFRIPALGGTPRNVHFDVDSRPAFSADRKRMAFFRHDPVAEETRLIVTDIDGNGERTIASRRSSAGFFNDAAWSPDGHSIAAGTWRHVQNKRNEVGLIEFDVESGAQKPIGPQDWWGFGFGIAWLPDGTALLATTGSAGTGYGQIWLVPYPSGRPRRITNDLSNYAALTITADGKSIAAIQDQPSTSLWSVRVSGSASMRQVVPSSSAGFSGTSYRASPGGIVLFVAPSRDGAHSLLWSMDRDGAGRIERSPAELDVLAIAVARRSGAVLLNGVKDDEIHIWKLDSGRSSPEQLTFGSGEHLLDVSPDGDEYLFRQDDQAGVWKGRTSGGKPVKFHASNAFKTEYSPDGRKILVLFDTAGASLQERVLEVCDRETAAVETKIPIEWFPGTSGLSTARWSPSGRELTFIRNDGGAGNLWSHPLDGGAPLRLTNFTSDEIDDFDWTPDGSELYVNRGRSARQIVLITHLR